MRTLPRVVCVLSCVAGLARGELPPKAYERMRADAPDVLGVRITRVDDTAKPDGGRAITLWASVTRVTRSANGAKPGDTVRIRYDLAAADAPPVVGPSPVPVPRATETLTAYLKRDGTVYRPAAGRASFENAKETGAPSTQPAGK